MWWYLDRLVNDARIQKGRDMLAQYRGVFDAVGGGVGRRPPHSGGDLGHRIQFRRPRKHWRPRRAALHRDARLHRPPAGTISATEFLATLQIRQRGDIPPDHLRGSWAGAFGQTQFMPTGYLRFAVDFDGDGRANLVDSIPDVLASTANRFKHEKWTSGQTWGYEVVLPSNFDYLLADRARKLSLRDWAAHGLRRVNGQPFPRGSDAAFLLLPAGARGPAFLMLENFRVIMRYNPAEAYALAIGHLADRLRGGAPFVTPWPRDLQLLSRAERFELQNLLRARGFEIGEPDGRIGGRTRQALRQIQLQLGLVPDGFATAETLALAAPVSGGLEMAEKTRHELSARAVHRFLESAARSVCEFLRNSGRKTAAHVSLELRLVKEAG